MRTISRFSAPLGAARAPLGAALALAAAVALGAAAPAATAGGWVLPAVTLAPATSGPNGAVAVDPGGDAVAAWTVDDGAGTQSLVVATRPAGGAWSDPQTLSDAGARGVAAPAVTIDDDGNATVVWIESADGSTWVARAARRDALGGSWSWSPDFAASTGTAVVDPETQVRAGAAGDVIAAWLEHDGAPPVEAVRAAVYSAASGTWGSAATLSDPTDASAADAPPQIAPDASGGPLVGWIAQRNADASDQPVQTSTLSGGGAWGGPTDAVPGDGNVRWPLQLVGADGGDVAAAWFETDATPTTTLYGALRSGGTWTVEPVSADAPIGCSPVPALGADPGGGATVAWEPGSSMGIDTVRLTSGGWGARVPVFPDSPTSTETASDPAIAHGTVVFVAHDPVSGTDSVLASRRQDDGTWSRPADLLAAAPSGTSLGPTGVATDAAGDALASWTASDSGGTTAISAAAFQAGGPQLGAVSVPGGGTAGVPLPVSVSASSAFASVAQVAWDFGDGSAPVAGASASHAYAHGGTYTVTVTATDDFGTASEATRQVTIAAPTASGSSGSSAGGSGGSGGTTGGSGPGGGSSPPRPAALLRPRVGGLRDGVLVLGHGSRTLRLLVRNLNRVRLTGGVSLVRPRRGRVHALTLARIRTAAFPGGRRVTLTLRLSDAALRALRGASGFRLPVVLTLRFRAADGRRATVTLRATLDASARYGFGGRTPARAHASC